MERRTEVHEYLYDGKIPKFVIFANGEMRWYVIKPATPEDIEEAYPAAQVELHA